MASGRTRPLARYFGIGAAAAGLTGRERVAVGEARAVMVAAQPRLAPHAVGTVAVTLRRFGKGSVIGRHHDALGEDVEVRRVLANSGARVIRDAS